jgi:hypothetical protein
MRDARSSLGLDRSDLDVGGLAKGAACGTSSRMLNFVVNIPIKLKDVTMADSKQDEGFKVVDRRLFTAEGDLREGAVEQERREEEAAASRAATLSEARAKAAAKDAAAHGDSAPATRPEASGQGGTALVGSDGATDISGPSRSFQMLVDFLTRNAAAMMGGMADPQTGQPFVDLEGAREVIDMLDALREKTRGNLAKADDDLMVEVLGSLKLTFMEVSKAAAAAMSKKAGQKK